MRSQWTAILGCLVLTVAGLLGPGSLNQGWAQDAGQVPVAPQAGADDQDPLREQTIYIPYQKLREVFEKEGRGVFLPYEKFLALWKAARDAEPRQLDVRPPLPTVIAEAENRASVVEDVVQVDATLKIEVLAQGWNEVPLRLSDAALMRAEIDGKPARVVYDAQHGYTLLVKNDTKEAKTLELKLRYAKAYEKAPGENRVTFQAPQAPVNRWQIRVGTPGVKVHVHPLIAASEVPVQRLAEVDARDFFAPGRGTDPKPNNDNNDGGNGGSAAAPGNGGDIQDGDEEKEDEDADDKKADDKEMAVLAFVGAAPTVTIDWTPKSEGATGLAALASVEAQQQVNVDEGVVRTRTLLSYEISRAQLAELNVQVPADHKVVNVYDANVRQWNVEVQDEAQTIRVQLFQPAEGRQNLVVELEKFSEDLHAEPLQVPVVKALDVGRQFGVVVVRLGTGLRGEATERSGLLQVDKGDLPGALARTEWNFAYRYASVPFQLALDIEPVEPRIQVDQLVEAYLQPERLTLEFSAIYDIQRAGVFQLDLEVPEGFEVRSVVGRQLGGSGTVDVDSFYREADEPTHLRVNLARKAMGKVGLHMVLEKAIEDANLLTPTGMAANIAIPVPRVAPEKIERASGHVVIFAPDSLRITTAKQEGLQSVSFVEAFANLPSQMPSKFNQTRPTLAFAFAGQATELELAAERRRPQITARQLLTVEIESGVARYHATFFYNIRYSGVKSLRLDLPASLLGKIHNDTSGIVEKLIDPAPDDLPENYAAWTLSGERELLGDFTLKFSWEEKIEKLDVGSSVQLNVPRLMPRDVDRAWGQIVLKKTETIDVHPEPATTGLTGIDPEQDLMPGAHVPGAARGFEFQTDDWRLVLKATRYKLESLKTTSIERAVVRIVATRSDQLAVQALYRVRSARQRLEVQLPGGKERQFDTDPLRINGQPIPLERGDADEFFIPLVGYDADTPVVVELRYTMPGGPSNLELPSFPEEPAVQKVFLFAYIPEELALLGYEGPWTDEVRWNWNSPWNRVAKPRYSADERIVWVHQGISLSGDPLESFPTDGDIYVYSTLRPDPPPAGSLQLVTMNENWLHGLMFVSLLVVGVALVARPMPQRLAAIALGLLALLVIGIFWPTFTMQMMDGGVVFALLLVLLVWVAMFLVRLRPGRWSWSLGSRGSSPFSAGTGTTTATAPEPSSGSGTTNMSSIAAGYGEAAKEAAEAKEQKKQKEERGDQSSDQGGEHHG